MALFKGCASHPPLPKASSVDIEQFMGPWYVLGYTPIIVDKKAHNAVEHYHLSEGGKIETTYQFRDGAFDGKLKTYRPTGFVKDGRNNAEWDMQFIWPFKSDYVIMYVAKDYSLTIIGHPNRKYAWIMAREPKIDQAEYSKMLAKIESAGFEASRIQRLPHDWSNETERLQILKDVGKGAMP